MRKNRILFGIWILILLVLFFFRGYPAVTAVLLMSILYLAAAFALVHFGGRNLQAEVLGGDMIEKGENMEVMITLINQGRLPVPCCCCELEVTNRLTGQARHITTTHSLPPGGRRYQTFELTDQYCGKIDIVAEHLQVQDPLRLFTGVWKSADSTMSTAGYFVPQIQPVDIPADFLDSYNMESYQYSQYQKGNDPGEVFSVREYQEGDSLKQIHWKLTAKLGEVTVRIPSFPIENNILVVLDNLLTPSSKIAPEEKSRLVELYYSLSAALLEKAAPHSIGWVDSEDESFVLHRIKSMEDLWETVPEVLGCGFIKSEISTIYRYLESREGMHYTNHFLVTAQEERDVERLEEIGAVKIFRTTE